MKKYSAKRKENFKDHWWTKICAENEADPAGTFLVIAGEFDASGNCTDSAIMLNGFNHGCSFDASLFIFKEVTDNFTSSTKEKEVDSPSNAVINPKHYDVMDEKVIEIIARCQTEEMFYGFCLGNVLKYRLRAGAKDDLVQEIQKADNYPDLYTKYKHLCRKE